jgi:uncharacterized membrane protein YphA (DoxX/SURF4 family)
MDALLLAARILIALVFLLPGIQVHLVERRASVQMARAGGASLPEVMVLLAGIAIVAGALMVALGVWADLGALLLGGFALGVAPIMHAFWKEEDEATFQNQFAHFAKNVGLAAGALLLIFTYDQLGANAALSLGEPLFVGAR